MKKKKKGGVYPPAASDSKAIVNQIGLHESLRLELLNSNIISNHLLQTTCPQDEPIQVR